MKKGYFIIPFICFTVIIISGFTILYHKYYHSYTTIEVNNTYNTLEIVSELIWHDAEKSLSTYYKKKVSINDPKIDSLLLHYYASHLIITSPNKDTLAYKWIGSELDKEHITIYLESKCKTLNKHTIYNSLLIATFPEQVNQMAIKDTLIKKTYVFSSKLTQHLISN